MYCNYLHWYPNDSFCFCLYLLGNIELAAVSLDDVIRRCQVVSLTVDMIDLTMKYQHLTVCIDILTILSVSVFISENFWFRCGFASFFWRLSSAGTLIVNYHLSNFTINDFFVTKRWQVFFCSPQWYITAFINAIKFNWKSFHPPLFSNRVVTNRLKIVKL